MNKIFLIVSKYVIYFQQIAEKFPYMTLYRILTTEVGFKKADSDESGVIRCKRMRHEKSIESTLIK